MVRGPHQLSVAGRTCTCCCLSTAFGCFFPPLLMTNKKKGMRKRRERESKQESSRCQIFLLQQQFSRFAKLIRDGYMGRLPRYPRGNGKEKGSRNFQRCDPSHKFTPEPAILRSHVQIPKGPSWLGLKKKSFPSLTTIRNDVMINALMLCGQFKCASDFSPIICFKLKF